MTPATSERAIVTTGRVVYSEAEWLAQAHQLTAADLQQAIREGQYITDSIIRSTPDRIEDMATDKSVRELVKLATEQGFSVAEDGTSIKWTSPEGRSFSSSNRIAPGRALANVRAQLRRLGLNVPRSTTSPKEALAVEPATDVLVSAPTVYDALAQIQRFITDHDHADEGAEWQSICEGLEADLATARDERDQATRQRDDALHKLETTKSTLRDLFN